MPAVNHRFWTKRGWKRHHDQMPSGASVPTGEINILMRMIWFDNGNIGAMVESPAFTPAVGPVASKSLQTRQSNNHP